MIDIDEPGGNAEEEEGIVMEGDDIRIEYDEVEGDISNEDDYSAGSESVDETEEGEEEEKEEEEEDGGDGNEDSEEKEEHEVVLRKTDRIGVSGFFVRSFYRILYICETVGEGLAWNFGITEPRFYDAQLEQEAMEQYQKHLDEQENQGVDTELRNLEENSLDIRNEGFVVFPSLSEETDHAKV